jgi:23S rRNA (guanosine2251-2'-O)-methyltransferase
VARTELLSGFHALEARLRAAPESIEVVYFDGLRRDARMRELLSGLERARVRCVAASAERLRGLAGDLPHQGVVALCRPRPARQDFGALLDEVGPDSLLLLLDGVTDPRNLGACLRTAEAAGVDAVIVPRDRSASLSSPAARAAAGAAESIPLLPVTNLARTMRELRDAGVRLVGAAGDAGHSIYDVELSGPLGWVLGAEHAGLRRLTRETCDVLASIPLAGTVESLNVAVAAGVCLFESVRQRRRAGNS